ncbi:hypothetical protein B0I33_1139 [Prauserella shujinwangii]|uniref:Uncharacterized protein n=1 Tax=Prauserella shujinwangii TaxID=1453103 RepID=A0A2T0LLC6_9PSEU|nr:hypothetical protein [Prauserella shujinwangii]PRX43846.1 hypothetical protein B0I33_1139 [Prauserella shujinwangii]
MKTGQITDRQAREVVDLAVDVDVCAAQEVDVRYAERDEIERLIEEVDREIAAEQRTASVRLSHEFTDQRRAWRSVRRAEREALRSLPARLDVAVVAESEAA